MNMINRNPSFTSDGSTGGGNQKIEVDPELLELNDAETTEEAVEAVEESIEPAETSEQEEPLESTEEVLSEETNEPVAPEVNSVVIGDKTYSQEELTAIVAKGTKVLEYETKTPGFNIDTLVPEFTRKSQRLAQYEKQLAANNQLNPEELSALGIEPEQVKVFEKLAKGLGFVRQRDLTERSVEIQKDTFLERHPEYLPTAVGGNDLWGQLMGEFNIYNWQANPHLVEQLLEESHKKVAQPIAEAKRGQETKKNIISNQKLTQLAATGGGGGSRTTVTKAAIDQTQVNKYRAAGWSESDIKELLT